VKTTAKVVPSHDRRNPRLTLLFSPFSPPYLHSLVLSSRPSARPLPSSSAALRAVVGSSTSVSPSCCTSSAARFLHRDKGFPRPPLRRKGSQESPDDDLSDHDHDHASIELTASVFAWQPSLSQNSPSPLPVTDLAARSLRHGFLHTGGIQTTFLDAPHCTTTGHNLLNDICGVARLFTTAQDGAGRC
jgi:hypothetical protein